MGEVGHMTLEENGALARAGITVAGNNIRQGLS